MIRLEQVRFRHRARAQRFMAGAAVAQVRLVKFDGLFLVTFHTGQVHRLHERISPFQFRVRTRMSRQEHILIVARHAIFGVSRRFRAVVRMTLQA